MMMVMIMMICSTPMTQSGWFWLCFVVSEQPPWLLAHVYVCAKLTLVVVIRACMSPCMLPSSTGPSYARASPDRVRPLWEAQWQRSGSMDRLFGKRRERKHLVVGAVMPSWAVLEKAAIEHTRSEGSLLRILRLNLQQGVNLHRCLCTSLKSKHVPVVL